MTTNPNNEYTAKRRQMVEQQLMRRGIQDPRVLRAMSTVPRHVFVEANVRPAAYGDHALPIGHGQTISQPYVVALMTEAAQIQPGDKVLEIGTGSGYGAAIAGQIAGQVYTIERHKDLADTARERFRELGYHNIHVIHGDGSEGWPAEAPYDAIIVTAAAPDLPQPLLNQLKDGGRLVVPVGSRTHQTLVRAIRHGDRVLRESLTDVRFVPLVGEYGWKNQ
ncbi:protein-L-isoaspartate(D-aspartate) O-methyltransferase [Candidatus Parcubacteria bacterium]|nr:MAG: protein-L-isoaspartate(D-aspartate) O-methyltransferase [Candidatus Parcubacteria bacterium]